MSSFLLFHLFQICFPFWIKHQICFFTSHSVVIPDALTVSQLGIKGSRPCFEKGSYFPRFGVNAGGLFLEPAHAVPRPPGEFLLWLAGLCHPPPSRGLGRAGLGPSRPGLWGPARGWGLQGGSGSAESQSLCFPDLGVCGACVAHTLGCEFYGFRHRMPPPPGFLPGSRASLAFFHRSPAKHAQALCQSVTCTDCHRATGTYPGAKARGERHK